MRACGPHVWPASGVPHPNPLPQAGEGAEPGQAVEQAHGITQDAMLFPFSRSRETEGG